MKALRSLALRYPEAEEGIACKGTALECSTFKAGNKAFLFVGAKDVKVKLRGSLAAAAKLAAKEPSRFQAGGHGWVSVKFSPDRPLPFDLLEKWIDESYRLLVPKQLVALLPACGPPIGEASKTAQKKAPKKGSKKKSAVR